MTKIEETQSNTGRILEENNIFLHIVFPVFLAIDGKIILHDNLKTSYPDLLEFYKWAMKKKRCNCVMGKQVTLYPFICQYRVKISKKSW